MQAQGGGLPYDAKIEYLQTDSAAYIDTGIAGDSDSHVIFIKYNHSSTVQYAGLYGNFYNDSHNCCRFILFNNASGYFAINSRAGGSAAVTISGANNMVELEHHRTYIIMNGVTRNVSPSSGGTANSRTIIVGKAGVGLTTRDIGLKVYYFRIENSGTTLFDGIPVRVGQVGYMYDRVSGQLFGNQGTGDFILGPDVQ